MDRLEAVFVALNRLLVALVLGVIFVIVFANVVGRYGFGSSFAWVEEVARHLMILGTFCGAGLALREGRLVAISTLIDLLPKPVRYAARWGIVLVMAAFMMILAKLGADFVAFGWPKETMSTRVSRGIPYLAIPIGCVLFLINLAFFARRFVHEEFETEGEPMDANGARSA